MKILYYCSRARELGIGGTCNALKTRLHRATFGHTWRTKALAGSAGHHWSQVAKTHTLSADFEQFWQNLPAKKIVHKLIAHPLITRLAPELSTDPFELIDQADQICDGNIAVLGYEPFAFGQGPIDWHTDHQAARHGFTSPTSWQTAFYQRITASPCAHGKDQMPGPDVKTCWELSRLHQLVTLGLAYQQAEQERAVGYAQTFQKQLTDWITNNPYLLGINWVCPMEVGIRAINMVWALTLFSDETTLPKTFWQRVVCSLYDHLHYLENNWETSDRPNNHYLADLLGHAYLTLFFRGDITLNYQTHIQVLLDQFNQQIFGEGTSYEGSTAYHKLVCEMLAHLRALFALTHTFMPNQLIVKHVRMQQFLDDCTDHGGNTARIGDDDSGKIVFGIATKPQTMPNLATYHDFGITIVRGQHWHITFRHASYQDRQPSGHFHQDQLAVTISCDGQPIFIDPGSFVYTPHGQWRNHFRSWQQHNTFGLANTNSIKGQQDLFVLPQKISTAHPHIEYNDQTITISDSYQSQQTLPIAYRQLHITNNTVTITDWWQHTNDNEQPQTATHTSMWNFVCSPDITLEQQQDGFCLSPDKKISTIFLQSDAPFSVCQDMSSPSYGQSRPTKKLTACLPFSQTPMRTVLHRL
ncbi:MAG: heparinase II/III family protein [Epsilonproteobacteria bacterium]|nr:heparinase II/III family protein [Campylobacterota bacterium]